MQVIPPVVPASQVPEPKNYRCPICHVQSTDDPDDTGWVRCPMVDDKFICLGCCIDHQKPARSENFSNHDLAFLFQDLSRQTRKSVEVLRRTCLLHQKQLLGDTDTAQKAFISRILEQIDKNDE